MTENRTPLEVALDLVLYAPVGLALTIGEEIPKLAAKGRARVGTQVSMARVVGQFAVQQGRRELDRRLGMPPASQRAPAQPPPVSPEQAKVRAEAEVAQEDGAATEGPQQQQAARGSPRRPQGQGKGSRPPSGGPSASELAIPGYDSLSASQVVQRLAGLSASELEQVRAYEAAHRARRTILARVAQLESG